MAAKARIAVITVLVIVVGVFLLIAGKKIAPPSGGWQPPPDPYLKDYIEAVQKASTGLYAATRSLLLTVSDASSHVGATFGAYDADAGVKDSVPAAARKGVDSAISSASEKLQSYAGEVGLFNTTVQAWTASTPDYALLGQKTAVDALVNDVFGPMAEFQAAAGQLSTFASDWTAAYEAASQGGGCGDCSQYRQSCVSGRCAATMNVTMQGLVADVGLAAKSLLAQGALATSPYQKLAGVVGAAYTALFDYVAGI